MRGSPKSYSNLSELIPPAKPAPVQVSRSAQEIDASLLMNYSLHLGHNKSLWHPKMLPFIYGERHDIHIINLDETISALRRATAFVQEVARSGGNVLFVGTRGSLHAMVMRVAKENDAFFCTHWIGGLMTNKERVLRRSVGYDPDKVSQSLTAQSIELDEDGDAAPPSKQPFVAKPDLLILLDYPNTKWAVHEANLAHVPGQSAL
ncbi:37S ribosomal protein, mitochondrial [Kappamyces sp. JEL0680]|nr:37S ribosomal protein, mitochondrial [Kappamyces sp. JEL0680]